MDTELDLTRASREALLALIAEQKAMIAQLQQRTAELEARLNARSSPGMPGNKPSSRSRPPRKGVRKRRDHGFARVRMAPTQWVEHAVEACPDCGTHLAGGWVQRTREVIEIPVAPVEVIEHVFIARVCPGCGRRHVPAVGLQGTVMGQQRFGVNLVSLMVPCGKRVGCPSGLSSGTCKRSIGYN